MIKDKIAGLIEKSIKELQKEGKLAIPLAAGLVEIEKPKEESHGDYSSNISLLISKIAKANPMETAKLIESRIKSPELTAKAVEPGFINFFVSKNYLQKQVREILKQGSNFGSLKIGKNRKINVEFISANPTGPLTLGNGRGGFCGDVLSNILEKAGYKTEKEYYINDVGEQIKKLGHSVINDKEAVYKGKYIEDLRKKIKSGNSDKAGEKAAGIILKEMIKPSVKKMGIKFDTWFSQKKLEKNKEIEKVLAYLKKKNLIYEKEGALWFKTAEFGDDKNRVLVKKDNEKTYLASDIAYLNNKFKRGFEKLIFFWGADHHGYINRIKASAEALGYKKEQVDVIIMQLVRLFKNGKEERMSKRTGNYIILDELIDEVGLDASRFFFLMRSSDTHLNFDMDLAKEQSKKNPVYYVQYAYARICSILRKFGNFQFPIFNFQLLNHKSELDLIKKLIRFPEIIEETAKDYQTQRLPQYAIELADAFHQFYENCQVISDNKELTQSRLALVSAVKIVLKNTLDLMGIKAPERM